MNWVRYGVGYLVALIVLNIVYFVLASFVDGVTAVLMIAPAIAAIYPISVFVKNEGRVPTPQERWQLVGLCFGIFLVVQSIQLGVAAAVWPDAFGDMVDTLGAGAFATVVLGTLLFEFALIWLMFRFYPQMQLRSVQNAQERKATKDR
ncbi:ABZJ_00895 family protein [Gordonia sp. (in: high G+C Gram-positive bacteria)]|uniref:ABZJ_00895 family protein n=1 Tax=Gordonia sp. (in: high G+C Gram-positive bacteria) TaxID=84139 RepID=UPI001690841D|nr:ABZJ_00895 family protein [Gordonia sp. (in: high G+C Gram-positive bacteria)]NLG47393.1 hypothetical protein [Gordonia sp. (in: high G+C Gram-positive bacteria)]